MQFLYDQTSKVTNEEVLKEAEALNEYIERLQKVAEADNYMYDESSINLPFDEKILEKVIYLKQKYVSKNLKYVIDIGIGGSNLGTKAIYDALYGYFDIIEPDRFPKIIFADTNDPAFLVKLVKFLKNNAKSPEEYILNAISKSGNTTETLVNLDILIGEIPQAKERLVVTTTYNSDLWKTARGLDIDCLPIPNKVGGRYSVFSAVGIFPLACIGLDIAELLKGAMEARKVCIEDRILKNPAALSAITLFINYKKGKLINDNFFFHPELESLGKWYRQLLAESIGKNGQGITPTVSLGSVDLHSMGQLYLDGIKDKVFNFVSARKHHLDIKVPDTSILDLKEMQVIENKKASDIMNAVLAGVKLAYLKLDIPFMEIILDDISPKGLAQFLQFKMIEVMYLGALMGVDTFNQPAVELYKKETRKILKGA